MRAIALLLIIFLLPLGSCAVYLHYSDCLQESPTIVNQTGRDNCPVNIYSYAGSFSNNSVTFQGSPSLTDDGIYNKSSISTTTQLADVTGEYYFTYIKPTGANRSSTIWRTVNGDVTGIQRITNNTLPASCWNYNSANLQLRATSSRWNTVMTWDCRNSTGWQTLYSENTFYYFVYDQAVYWGFDIPQRNLPNEIIYEGEKHQIYDNLRITGASIHTLTSRIILPFFVFILFIVMALVVLLIIKSTLSQGLLNSFNKR